MKTPLSIVLGLILAPAAAVGHEPLVIGRFHSEYPSGTSAGFGPGAERRGVVAIMGLPDYRIGDVLWIYRDAGIAADDPRASRLDALVIAFKRNRVATIRLADSTTLRDLIARHKLKVTGPALADPLR